MPKSRTAAALALSVGLGALACDGSSTPRLPTPPPSTPPPVAASLRLVVPGNARLTGSGGTTACSHDEPASADGHRWCAFYRPVHVDRSRTELWVVDVTRVMAGEEVPCDGTSPACLLMTDRLFTELRIQSLSHPEGHRFEGDTLFFLGPQHPAAAKLERFEGLVWAWRPGWERPRPLTSDRGVLCRGNPTSAAAICVDGISERPSRFDLRAGRIVDDEHSMLPLVERIAAIRNDEIIWSAFFSPAGDVLGFSSWRDGEPTEALRVVDVDELGVAAPRTVVQDGRGWRPSADGQGVSFLRGSKAGGPGALWAADFPSGEDLTQLGSDVFDFEPVGADGVAFRTELRGFEGTLKVIPERQQPAQVFQVRDAHAWYPLDGGRFLYILQADEQGERGLVADVERGTSCLLGSRPGVAVYAAAALPALGLVTWNEPIVLGESPTHTFVGRADDCSEPRLLGENVDLVQAIGKKGLAYAVKETPEGGPLAFYYVPTFDERPLEESAQVILDHVDGRNVGRIGGTPEALLLGTLPDAPDGPGLYVFGPLPPR